MSTVLHPSAVVAAGAEIGDGAEIGPFCVIGPQVRIGAGCRLMAHVVVDGLTRLGEGCTVFPFASLGTQTQDLKYKGGPTYVEIGDRTTIREYVTVNSGTKEGEITRVGSQCHIMAYCHVAHGSTVGDGVIMANGASLSGEVTVEDQVVIGGMTGIHQFVRIGRLCMVGGMSKITQDCMPFMMIDGNPAQSHGPNRVGLQRRNVSEESQSALKQAYRIICRLNLTTSEALAKVRAEVPSCPEVDHLLAFIERSERGIIK